MKRRYDRTWALTVSVTIVALIAIGPLHLALEQHVWCADHRELVRAHPHDGLGHSHQADHHHHGPAAGDHQDDRREGGHPGGRPGLPHSHDEDACAWALLLQAPGATPAPPLALPAPAAVPVVTPPAVLPDAPRPIDVLRYAPSHSPPALPV